MSWSGGAFTRVHDWTTDAGALIGIDATRHDEEDDNLAAGINDALHKSGQNSPTANINWGGYKLTNLGAGTAASDAARLDQAQFQTHAFAFATGSANAYAVSLSPAPTAYTTGMVVRFRPNANNTGACTVDVNGLGAKSIFLLNGDNPGRNDLNTFGIAEVVYDGTDFALINPARPFIGCYAYNSAFSVPNNTTTAVALNTESYDTDNWHDTITNNSRMTVPQGISRIRAYGDVRFILNSSTGARGLYIFKNGAIVAGSVSPTSSTNSIHLNVVLGPVSVVAGNYFELAVLQSSGGAMDVHGELKIEAVP